jgi:NodT family efflux transporter outer membrane factor (OMF) lipoprotein
VSPIFRRVLSPRYATILVSILTLAACTLGPDYHTPALQDDAKQPFEETHANANVSSDAAVGDWWELYDEPALKRLVLDAFLHNADTCEASANLRLARAQLSEARAGRLPTTGLSAGYSRDRVGADNLNSTAGEAAGGGGFASDSANFNYFEAGFDASYEIDVFGRVSRSIEAAHGDAGAAQAALDGARISVAAQVAQSYADACGFAAQADVARETARIEGDTLNITQHLLDAGKGTRRDVDQATVLVEQARAEIPALESERRAQLYALATLTGRAPAEIDESAAQCQSVPKVKTPIPVGDGAALLARRPDVRQAQYKLAADTARIGVATAELLPSVTLAGSATLGAPKLGNLGQSPAFGYSFGPLISWTFPNVAVARARIAQSKAGADASLAAYDGTMLTALRETEQALARYNGALDQNASLARAAQAADDAADLSRARFEAGRDNFLDLLVAEQNRAAARRALSVSDTRVADHQVSLFKALGGGWEHAPAAPKAQPVASN